MKKILVTALIYSLPALVAGILAGIFTGIFGMNRWNTNRLLANGKYSVEGNRVVKTCTVRRLRDAGGQ
jgi:hypothetical protein